MPRGRKKNAFSVCYVSTDENHPPQLSDASFPDLEAVDKWLKEHNLTVDQVRVYGIPGPMHLHNTLTADKPHRGRPPKAATAPKEPATKHRGRPKGSKNKQKLANGTEVSASA